MFIHLPDNNAVIDFLPKTGFHYSVECLKQLGKRYNIIKDDILPDYCKHYLVIRHLPDWWLSYMWHESKHVYMTHDNTVAKAGYGSEYSSAYKQRSGFLPLPRIASCSFYPDVLLMEHSIDNVVVLRQENLTEDWHTYFGYPLKTSMLGKKEYSYLPPDWKQYWSKEHIDRLYMNNWMWASLENETYGELQCL